MKRQYEGEIVFKYNGGDFRSCTYGGNCLWKLTHDGLVGSEKIVGRNASRVPKFLGHICNSPDNMVTTCPQL